MLAKPIEARIVGERRLRQSAPRDGYASGEIVRLEDGTATLRFRLFDNDPEPEVGWKLSTRLR